MKNNCPVLEYYVGQPKRTRKARWGFRFKTAAGDLLISSPNTFSSKANAERGFVSLIKSVATNQYCVECPEDWTTGSPSARRNSRRPLKIDRSSRIPRLQTSRRRRNASAYLL